MTILRVLFKSKQYTIWIQFVSFSVLHLVNKYLAMDDGPAFYQILEIFSSTV